MHNRTVLVETKHLFYTLDSLLIELLQSLSNDDWHKPTIAKQWTVKDVAAHLLDGNIKMLSFARDKYLPTTNTSINSYQDLVNYINALNNTWVAAAKRISPAVLIELLQITGKPFCNYIQELPPFDAAIFSVAWAGETTSANWFHIAREYTEKFIHQQQIRDAVGKQALFTKELFQPFIHTLLFALPHQFKNVEALTNTTVQISITSTIGGNWYVVKTNNTWQLTTTTNNVPTTIVRIEPTVAWKLFSKGITADEAKPLVLIEGKEELANHVLQTVAVMA